MIAKLTITSVGNSAGAILPKEVLEKPRAGKGDTLFLTETPAGSAVPALDEEFSLLMRLAVEIMRKDRDVLHQLAR